MPENKKKKEFFDAKLTCDLLKYDVKSLDHWISRVWLKTIDLEDELRCCRIWLLILSCISALLTAGLLGLYS